MSDKDKMKAEAIRAMAAQFDFDATAVEVHILLQRASQQIGAKLEEGLAKNNFTRGRFIPLAVLFGSPDKRMKPSELAESAGVTRATMTGLIDSLEENGLVKRITQADDRRAMDIQLTAKGDKLIRKLLPAHFKLMTKIMEGVTESDRKSLASAFKKISSNLEKMK